MVENINKNNKGSKDLKRIFNYNRIVKNVPFFFFLALLAVLYIYNGHHSDKLVRKISETEKNIKELEYRFKKVKSDLIFRSKASELVKAVEPLGLKELQHPPILLNNNTSVKVTDSLKHK